MKEEKKNTGITGLFSGKAEECAVCGSTERDLRYPIKEGVICGACKAKAKLAKAGENASTNFDANQILERMEGLNQSKQDFDSFEPTIKVKDWLWVDENTRRWTIPSRKESGESAPKIYSYDDLAYAQLF